MREEAYGTATEAGAKESVLLDAIFSAHDCMSELEVQVADLSSRLEPVKVDRAYMEAAGKEGEPSMDSRAVQKLEALKFRINTLSSEIASLKNSLQV